MRVDAALADLLAVDVERARRRPCRARRRRRRTPSAPGARRRGIGSSPYDLELLQAEEVVAVRRPPVLGVEAPAAERAALGDDHAVRRRPRARRSRAVTECDLFLIDDDGVLGQPAHAAEEQLRVAADELRPAGEVGVEALEAAVVERQDVVLRGLDQEEPLQLARASRAARPRGRAPASSRRARRAPRRRRRRRASRSTTHGMLCRVTAVQPWW